MRKRLGAARRPSAPEGEPSVEMPVEAPVDRMTYGALLSLAWKRTLAAWPLLVVQGVFMAATAVFVFASAVAVLAPLVLRFEKDHPGLKFQDLRGDALASLVTPQALGGLLVLAALVILWLFLIGLFVKGGTYGRLWDQAKTGVFSLKGFWGDGASLFVPLLGYQTVSMGLVLALALPVLTGGVLVVALGKSGHGVGALLALLVGVLVLLLVCVPLLLVGACYLYLVLAHLTGGDGVWEAFRGGWKTLRRDDARALKLLGGVLGVSVAAMFAVGLFFGILELIPVVKYLAWVAKPLLNVAFGAFWSVYLPALTVAFLHEAESGGR